MPYAWDQHVLSYATGPAGLGVLIAVRPERLPIEDAKGKATGDEVIIWYDHDHQRAFDLKTVDRDDFAAFDFTDNLDRKFKLRPMDLDAYNRKVKPKLVDAQSFKNETDLRRFFTEEIYRYPME